MTAHDNPIGLDGFEFVEFTSPDPEALARMFSQLGFTHVGTHRRKAIRHYCQGDIHFLLNMEPAGHAAEFRGAHGPSACAMAFRVGDAGPQLHLDEDRERRHRLSQPVPPGQSANDRPEMRSYASM